MKMSVGILLGLFFLGLASGETVQDREGAVRKDAAEMADNDRWIYNDVASGFAEAKRSGKPLMVVLRCVPCLACMGLDTEVLMESEELAALMDEFVRVRLINANAIDLSLFQFDYDLSFSILFFHPDSTVLGRFGSWEHQKNPENKTTSGLRQAMQRAIALHRDIDGNREALKGKKGDPSPFRTPIDIPAMDDRFRPELDWDGQVVKSCVHCHQIGDALRLEQRDAGKVLPISLIAPYPSPETIGVHLAADPVTKIERVDVGSPAEFAGLEAGDEILTLDGQPLVSVADIAWVLHRTAEIGDLSCEVERGNDRIAMSISLPERWRERSDISRRVGTWPMRAMAFGGMKLEDLETPRRVQLGIEEDRLALEALHVGQYNKHAAAKQAGFRMGDVIVEIGGSDERMSESELIMRHLQNHKPGEKIPAVVLRAGERVDLMMPIQ